MGKERTVITQQLCDHVKALLAGGLTISQAAKFANVGEATVGRIKAAGFDAEQYRKNMRAQKQREQEEKKKRSAVNEIFSQSILIAREEDNQVPGQMEMDLAEKKKPANYEEAMKEALFENEWDERDKKFMRFEAGQVEKICGLLTRIDDKLAQLLRRTDK